jgi:methylglutaconyl-CoA hydratase
MAPLEQQGAVLTITLNRPEVRNAFNDEVIQELIRAFHEVGQRSDVRAVVLAAEGPAFCAGADLNWMRRMADYTRTENVADAAALAAMLRLIYTCPKPTVARIQGDVFAGGVGLVAVCDMAVSVDTAAYCLSEVKLGLVPATVSPYVIRAMGARAAHRYFLTAERFSADEAQRIGFVHAVVRAEQLDAKVDELLQGLLSAGPAAVRARKALLHDVAEQAINAALIARAGDSIADIGTWQHVLVSSVCELNSGHLNRTPCQSSRVANSRRVIVARRLQCHRLLVYFDDTVCITNAISAKKRRAHCDMCITRKILVIESSL